MKRLLYLSVLLSFGASAQSGPDARYILPGTAEYYRNAANDALTARAYALQCVDEYAQLKAKMDGPTPGGDDRYYTGD